MKARTLAFVALAATAACSDAPPNQLAADPAAELSPVPAEVVVHARDFGFDMPDTVSAGTVTFRLVNEGPDYHHLELVRLDEGHTLDELMRIMQDPAQGWPAWAKSIGGPNTPGAVGESTQATMQLEPGNYVAFCFIPSPDGVLHVMKGMVKPLTVVPSTAPAAPLPEATVVMTLSDYSFATSAPITAGRQVIRMENTAAQAHEVVFVKLEAGRTAMEFAQWVEKREGEAPGKIVGGIAGLAPGLVSQATIDFEPGEYALLCFVPDAGDGVPHVAHGMIQQVTVM